ncbi:nuclear transport factor 2 family protein [Pendulispora rubella]|uniref:Nuclear transport factor 2 family protein n=1 Tax=Pendulispora rubella TaxID=2741070 RepID=A0ABZ2L896_9BACT
MALTTLVAGCHAQPATSEARASSATALSAAEFRALMNAVAEGWNGNDARKAVDCFTDDALYSSPPSPRVRRGRAALYEFFGGAPGRPRPMRMQWHHLVFDESTQIGAGEYTFEYEVRTHGVVMLRLRDGKISNWREYEQESRLSWDDAVGENRF